MKISSWNVNSVRARIINIVEYLKDANPEILMIQEIKTERKNFPFDEIKLIPFSVPTPNVKSFIEEFFISFIY